MVVLDLFLDTLVEGEALHIKKFEALKLYEKQIKRVFLKTYDGPSRRMLWSLACTHIHPWQQSMCSTNCVLYHIQQSVLMYILSTFEFNTCSNNVLNVSARQHTKAPCSAIYGHNAPIIEYIQQTVVMYISFTSSCNGFLKCAHKAERNKFEYTMSHCSAIDGHNASIM